MHMLDRWGLAADACVVVRAGCRPTHGKGWGCQQRARPPAGSVAAGGPWLSAHTHVAAVSHPGRLVMGCWMAVCRDSAAGASCQ